MHFVIEKDATIKKERKMGGYKAKLTHKRTDIADKHTEGAAILRVKFFCESQESYL